MNYTKFKLSEVDLELLRNNFNDPIYIFHGSCEHQLCYTNSNVQKKLVDSTNTPPIDHVGDQKSLNSHFGQKH